MAPKRLRSSGAASSSGESSPTPSPSGSKSDSQSSERVGSWAMDDLAISWDNCDGVRSRLRENHHLMMHWDPKTSSAVDAHVEKNVGNLKVNHEVLSPMFKLMGANDRTLPNLDRLMEQVTKLFEKSKCRFNKHGDRVYQEAWAIRRLCSLGKAQLHRYTWPKDSLLIELPLKKKFIFIYFV